MIPPLLGFYSKLFVISSIAQNHAYILAIFTILFSVISCVRYLNLIQVSNFSSSFKNSLERNDSQIISNLISIITMFLLLSFLNPIYILSSFSALL